MCIWTEIYAEFGNTDRSDSLVTKLAKDLEGEFYPYYPRMLSCVLPLVYHQDIKLLESVFNCIAYLFKFLSRQILPDLDQTFL